SDGGSAGDRGESGHVAGRRVPHPPQGRKLAGDGKRWEDTFADDGGGRGGGERPRRHRAARRGGGPAGGAGGGGAGQPGEERVPIADEPRAQDADELDPRL